jgi:hypothetical protein
MRYLPLLLAAGCSVDRGPWDDVPITRAWFSSFHLHRLDAVVGFAEGDALLGFDGPAGDGAVPVHLGGGGVGLLLDVAADPEGHDGVVEVDLSEVDAPSVGDVLGTYRGTGAQGAVIVGGSTRRLRNGRGASFREGHLVVGVAVFAGFEWLVVREGGDDGSDGPPPPTLTTTKFPPPTGDTAPDTAAPGWIDTALAPPATPSSGCGCGGGGGDAASEGTEPTDLGPTATSTPPTGDDDDDDTATAGGGTSSEASCDGEEDSGCSHGNAVSVGVLWAGLLMRRRSTTRARTTRDQP